MKKIISMLLAVVLVLGLCACGSSDTAKETEPKLEGLCVGYSK